MLQSGTRFSKAQLSCLGGVKVSHFSESVSFLELCPLAGVVKGLTDAPARSAEEQAMTLLKWALIFLVVSIIAGLLGFTGISAASADIARFLFYVFVVIFLVLLILGLTIFRV
jgi:uncharacterized membrane protein YtjA (UPF0391 family)